jgi:protein-tyrosine phosphatase
MSGLVDLHLHYVPAVDDGVRTLDESRRMLEGLAALGYERCVATPHIRSGMFENRKPALEQSFSGLRAELAGTSSIPELGLASEHFFDDVFWDLFQRDQVLPYPGRHAILVELHPDRWPHGLTRRFFDMQVRGLRPVIAHPERYTPLASSTEPLDALLDAGAMTQLDLMSLVGRYGDRPRRVAERMLEEGAYDIACSDAHRPEDVELVGRSIERLRELVGDADAESLLATNPAGVLDGSYDP